MGGRREEAIDALRFMERGGASSRIIHGSRVGVAIALSMYIGHDLLPLLLVDCDGI